MRPPTADINGMWLAPLLFSLTALAGQQNIPSELLNNLPESLEIRNGLIVEKYNCTECGQIERGIASRLESHQEHEVILIAPDSYPSWEYCLQQNEKAKVFRLIPGDYRSWGTLKLYEKADLMFTADNISSITGQNSTQHPVNLPFGKQVLLENFLLLNCANVILNGLIFSGNDLDPTSGLRFGWTNRIVEGRGNLINKCVVKNVRRGSAVRMLNTDENTISNTVFEQEDPVLTGDHAAVLLAANEGRESRGNKILNNEIRNWNDGFMLGWNRAKKQVNGELNHQTGHCPATLFAYNNIYLTEKFRTEDGGEAFAENAVDLKTGSATNASEEKVVIAKNKIWGLRRTAKRGSSGSAGEAITLHIAASNIFVTDNVIFDVPVGITIFSNAKKYAGETVDNIVITKNLFSQIEDRGNFHHAGSGIILNTEKVTIRHNVFQDVNQPVNYLRKENGIIGGNNYISPDKEGGLFVEYEVATQKWMDDPLLKTPTLIKIRYADAPSRF